MGIIYAKDFLDKLKQFHDWINGNTTSSVDGSVIDYKPKIAGYDDENDVIKVSQSGSILTENIFASEIRTDTTEASVQIPDWAKSAYFKLTIAGVTGTFASGEGINLRTSVWNLAPSTSDPTLISPKSISVGNFQTHIWQAGANVGDMQKMRDDIQIAPVLVGEGIRCWLEIDGTFANGEGIDCRLDVTWRG